MFYGIVFQVIVLLIIMSYLAVNSVTSSDYLIKSTYIDGMLKQEDTLSKIITSYKKENGNFPQNLTELKEKGYVDESHTIVNPFSKIGKIKENFEVISKNEIAFKTSFSEKPNANLYKNYYKSKLNGYIPTCEKEQEQYICSNVYYIGD